MVTYWKSTLRSVRSSLSRFLAIFSIVALGVGFLAGLLSTTPDMRYSAGAYNAETHLMDLRVVSTLGLTEADAEAVRAIAGVSAVMPAHVLDKEVVTQDGDTAVARIHGVGAGNWGGDAPDYLNRLTLDDGRWPEAENECVIEVNYQFGDNAAIGTTLTLADDTDSDLGEREFTIVGTVTSAYYLARSQRGATTVGSGHLSYIVYLDDACFNLDYYTDLFVAVEDSASYGAYSQAYDDFVDGVQTRLETLGETQRLVRRDQLRETAQTDLENARNTLESQRAQGQAQLNDAAEKLAEGARQLEAANQKLTGGERDYTAGVAALKQAKATFEQEYQAARQQLEAQEQALAAAPEQLTAAQTKLDGQKQQLQATDQALANARTQLEQAQALLDACGSMADAIAGLKSKAENQTVTAADFLPVQQAAAGFCQSFSVQAEAIRQMPAANRAAVQQLLLDTYDLCVQLTGVNAQGDLNAALTPLTGSMGAVIAKRNAVNQSLAGEKQTLEQSEAKAAQGWAALTEGQKQLTQKWADYHAGVAALPAAKAQLETGRQTALSEFSAGEKKLSASRLELDGGWKDYRLGTARQEEGQAAYQSSLDTFRQEIQKAEDAIRAGEDAVRAIEDPDWYVLDRRTLPAYVSYDSDTQKVEAIARIFPVFFFLVAALVASTTMTRMVEDERGQIGLLKALGYSNSVIAGKFLAYAGAASLLGSGVGLAFGLSLFPRVIYNAYGLLYNLPPLRGATHWIYGVLSTALIVLAILVSTGAALHGSLRDCAAALMRPKAPPAGKRIWLEYIRPVWRRMSFTYKVTARNLFRYKRRFLMTVIGVAGCTALLLAGFGLRNSIGEIVSKQFEEIQLYNLTIELKHAGDETNDPRIGEILADGAEISDFMRVHTEPGTGVRDEEETSLSVVVPEDAAQLEQFMNFRHRKGHESVPLMEGEALITEKAARILGVSPGDVITLRDADGKGGQVTVGDITENYVSGYLFLTRDTYEAAMGQTCSFTTLYAKGTQTDLKARDALATRLLESPNVASVQFSNTVIESFQDMLASVDYIVVVLIISAAALALVVLYNLTNINIAERQKELATLKVLGFYRRELSGYIFREGILLTLIGTAAGLVAGIFLHAFVVQTAEVEAVMFGRQILPSSYLFSAGLTVVFSVLVNLVMERKLRAINMVESLKEPE